MDARVPKCPNAAAGTLAYPGANKAFEKSTCCIPPRRVASQRRPAPAEFHSHHGKDSLARLRRHERLPARPSPRDGALPHTVASEPSMSKCRTYALDVPSSGRTREEAATPRARAKDGDINYNMRRNVHYANNVFVCSLCDDPGDLRENERAAGCDYPDGA